LTKTSHSKAPKVGDLVSWVEDVGIVEEIRGASLKIRWTVPIKNGFDDKKVDSLWIARRSVEILSRA
jgi:hypothetical protein